MGRQPAHIAARFSVAHPWIKIAVGIRAISNILLDLVTVSLRLIRVSVYSKPKPDDIKDFVQKG